MARCRINQEQKTRNQDPTIVIQSRRDDRSVNSFRPVGATNEAVALFSWAHARPWARAHGYNMPSRRDFRRVTIIVPAATRRQDVAMGASPWTSSPQLSFTPEETKGASIHSAPLGLRTWRLPRFHGLTHNHGLTPMATTCRPVGTFGDFQSTKMHPEPGSQPFPS